MYAWLSTHNISLSIIWFVGAIIPISGGIRSLVSLSRISEIAAYLCELEKAFFTIDTLPKGWEIYFNKGQSGWKLTMIAGGFWVFLLIITVLAPFFLGK